MSYKISDHFLRIHRTVDILTGIQPPQRGNQAVTVCICDIGFCIAEDIGITAITVIRVDLLHVIAANTAIKTAAKPVSRCFRYSIIRHT